MHRFCVCVAAERKTRCFSSVFGQVARASGRSDHLDREPELVLLAEGVDGALGEYLTDQWMLPLALAVYATGQPAAFTCTELSLHARTQIETVAAFLPVRLEVEKLARAWRVTLSPSAAVPA